MLNPLASAGAASARTPVSPRQARPPQQLARGVTFYADAAAVDTGDDSDIAIIDAGARSAGMRSAAPGHSRPSPGSPPHARDGAACTAQSALDTDTHDCVSPPAPRIYASAFAPSSVTAMASSSPSAASARVASHMHRPMPPTAVSPASFTARHRGGTPISRGDTSSGRRSRSPAHIVLHANILRELERDKTEVTARGSAASTRPASSGSDIAAQHRSQHHAGAARSAAQPLEADLHMLQRLCHRRLRPPTASGHCDGRGRHPPPPRNGSLAQPAGE